MTQDHKTDLPRRRYLLILFQARGAFLHRDLARDIKKQIEETITSSPDSTEIDMWIDSPGGDAHASYKLFLYLRHKCAVLRAVIPDFAKSAATLLVLGADEIYMAPDAELGPLDAQVEHPDKERTILSALDVANSLESLARISLWSAYEFADQCTELMDLPRSDALKITMDYMAHFVQPAIAKLDPHRIHQATNFLSVASDYGVRMLASRKLSGGKVMGEAEAQRVVRRLVRNYGDHGFIISREEAKNGFGLPVLSISDYPHLGLVQGLHDKFKTGASSLVKIIEDSVLDPKPKPEAANGDGKSTEKGNGFTEKTNPIEIPIELVEGSGRDRPDEGNGPDTVTA